MNHLPIVGARFRPPADTILGNLPAGVALLLVREPTNEYDQNAIQVQLPSGWQANLPADILKELMDTVSLLPEAPAFPADDTNFQLGFIPKGLAAELAPMMDNAGEDLDATLGFLPNGQPCVELEGLEEEEEEEELDEEEDE